MRITDTREYKRAFVQYLRRGTPIDVSLKSLIANKQTTTHYIWRTQGDGKVRPEHAANDGKIFAWDHPPPTGHPGEDYGCRCWAEPYIQQDSEYISHALISSTSSIGDKWYWYDFVLHAYAPGTDVTLSQIGHLEEIIHHYFYVVDGGRLEALNEQIIQAARNNGSSSLRYSFSNSYSFRSVSYPHGHSTISGEFRGTSQLISGMLAVDGNVYFHFEDTYTDTIDLREIIHGTSDPQAVSSAWRYISDGFVARPYRITDSWKTSFKARVRSNANESKY
jgi:hypothetical protein